MTLKSLKTTNSYTHTILINIFMHSSRKRFVNKCLKYIPYLSIITKSNTFGFIGKVALHSMETADVSMFTGCISQVVTTPS